MANEEEKKPRQQFDPITKEQLQEMRTAMELNPIIVEGAAQAPSAVHESLENAPKELLEGYLLGATQVLTILDAASRATAEGKTDLANALGNRMNTVNYMIAKYLLEGQSRIITPNSGKIIH